MLLEPQVPGLQKSSKKRGTSRGNAKGCERCSTMQDDMVGFPWISISMQDATPKKTSKNGTFTRFAQTKKWHARGYGDLRRPFGSLALQLSQSETRAPLAHKSLHPQEFGQSKAASPLVPR